MEQLKLRQDFFLIDIFKISSNLHNLLYCYLKPYFYNSITIEIDFVEIF